MAWENNLPSRRTVKQEKSRRQVITQDIGPERVKLGGYVDAPGNHRWSGRGWLYEFQVLYSEVVFHSHKK